MVILTDPLQMEIYPFPSTSRRRSPSFSVDPPPYEEMETARPARENVDSRKGLANRRTVSELRPPPIPPRPHHSVSLSSLPSLNNPLPNLPLQDIPRRVSVAPPPPHPAPFYRPLPDNLSYNHFPPAYLIAKGKFLDSGFPLLPPPSPLRTHFFATHDVNQGDWVKFLTDIRKCATLSNSEIITASVVPLALTVGLTGMLLSNAVKAGIKRRREQPVCSLIAQWNHHFFHPRRIDVVLGRGQTQISGYRKGILPNLDYEQESHKMQLSRPSSVVSPPLSPGSSTLPDPGFERSCNSRKRKVHEVGKRESAKCRKQVRRERRADNRRIKHEFKEGEKRKKESIKAEAEERKQLAKDIKRDKTYRLFLLPYDPILE